MAGEVKEPIVVVANCFRHVEYYAHNTLKVSMKNVIAVCGLRDVERIMGLKLKKSQIHYYTTARDFDVYTEIARRVVDAD